MPKPVTLKAVAQHASVSYQTVSKVLRNEGNLSPELRVRVQQAIDELGYRPNAAAQTLRTQASRLIGYSWCVGRKKHSSFILDQFQHSIVDSAENLGYHILLVPQREAGTLDAHFQELIDARRVDGFILSSVEYDDPRLEAMQRVNVPFVSFGQPRPDARGPFVEVDSREGMRQVVRHLIAEGHTRIAIIAWPEASRVGALRLAGYTDAMAEGGLPIDPAWVIRGEGEIDYGYSTTTELLTIAEPCRPTAIVTLLDTIAIGAMQAVETCGLKVGADIAVTGFDDMPAAYHLTPGLTTVRQPIWEVGRAVISLLVAQLTGEQSAIQPLMLSPELVIRESTQGYGRADHEEGVLSTASTSPEFV